MSGCHVACCEGPQALCALSRSSDSRLEVVAGKWGSGDYKSPGCSFSYSLGLDIQGVGAGQLPSCTSCKSKFWIPISSPTPYTRPPLLGLAFKDLVISLYFSSGFSLTHYSCVLGQPLHPHLCFAPIAFSSPNVERLCFVSLRSFPDYSVFPSHGHCFFGIPQVTYSSTRIKRSSQGTKVPQQ